MSLFLRRLAGGLLALSAVTAMPAMACHTVHALSTSSTDTGGLATYTVSASPNFSCSESFGNPHTVTLTFPAGYDLSAASFDKAGSTARPNSATAYAPFPVFAEPATINAAARTVTISGIQYTATWQANYRLNIQGVKNPTSAGAYNVGFQFTEVGQTGNSQATASVTLTTVLGVNIGATPTVPLVYASEIIATPAVPVTLTNGGALNLLTPLGYNFSSSEVRHARIECGANMQFNVGSAVSYSGGGSASVGAINGLGSSAIYFSITANNASVSVADRLTVNGNRSITGTAPVSCTYGLYDQPSQAAAGGPIGRVASFTGSYLAFAPSTTFTATGRTSVANVEANPAFTAFLLGAPTTATTAALAPLAYALAAPAPLKASGTAIALTDLHATGATGTRIVIDGDFTAAANANGSFSGAEARVYLSANNSSCTSAGSMPAAALSATQASFNVGATATDRMLCLAPLAGREIPASSYTATLSAKSAAPTVYALNSIGPLSAGAITRNGTELQAPLVQVPPGYVSRLVLTNTGGTARPYTIAVQGEDGNTVSTANLSGTVPANGTRVIDLNTVLTGFTAAMRATLNVTVAGSATQIQGLYQIVNPSSGMVSNHMMVRPGTN